MEGRDELLRYNVDGIALNAAGARKLQEEIALSEHSPRSASASSRYASRLLTGVVPMGHGGFREIAIREGRCVRLDASTGAKLGWSETPYFEVCMARSAPERPSERSLATASA
jgi:hypothetical protein